MKKLFYLAIAVLAVSLTSCGGSQDSKNTEDQSSDTTEVVAPVTPPVNDVDSPAVIEETTVEETAPATK